MIAVLKIILYPFSLIYRGITSLRNYLYDKRIFKSTQFDIPLIGVGNLAVGGTGKTPMVEYLVKLLYKDFQLATLSRGYGRKTRGFRTAGEEDDPGTIGDEPFQIYKKFGNDITIAVGEERVLAVPRLLYNNPEVQTIILDDAFQHRAVKPLLQILLTSYSGPFYNDQVIPAGRLRESKSGAARADVIVVTKCPPDLSKHEMQRIKDRILDYSGHKPVFFSKLAYGEPLLVAGKPMERLDNVLLVSGIAQKAPLIKQVSTQFNLLKHFSYSDHYNYKPSDIMKIKRYIGKKAAGVAVITTEKDAVKLEKLWNDTALPLYALPVEMEFLADKDKFEEIVRRAANYKED